ncbi:hypothetical protein KI387_012429, partial [Taxus chinensis]
NDSLQGLMKHVDQAQELLKDLDCIFNKATSLMKEATSLMMQDLKISDEEHNIENSSGTESDEGSILNDQKLELSDYVSMMSVVYGMLRQDYAMQEEQQVDAGMRVYSDVESPPVYISLAEHYQIIRKKEATNELKGKLVKMQNENTWLLKDVKHVPTLRQNLLSSGQLGSDGFTVIFTMDSWKVTKGALLVARALIENETGLKLKCLRSNNGGEYCNNEFDDYYSKNGIHRKKMVPRTLQQNGVSERMNMTIMEHVRSMRLHAGLPLYGDRLRSDNGGEYCNNEFDDYYSKNGIHRKKMVPRTLQQNGVSERMNMTIMEHVRSMRLHAGLPLYFWAEAVSTDVYLINRGPSSALDGGIPEEAWYGKNMQEIKVLKKQLSESFAMKDLRVAKQILGMRISRDRKEWKLTLSQEEYINKVLERFNMQDAKPIGTPLAGHFKLSKEQCPKIEQERN